MLIEYDFYVNNELGFIYRADTGQLWHSRDKGINRGAYAGQECSLKPGTSGYLTVRWKQKTYQQHRIIWFIIHGYFPKEMDHINGVTIDNRLFNLREVSRTENMRNKGLHKNNTSGFVGVTWYRWSNKWVAQIEMGGRNKCLGYFTKKEDAIAARKAAEIKYGFHENHGSQRKYYG